MTAKKPRSASPKKIIVRRNGEDVIQNNSRPKLWSEAHCKKIFPKAIEGSGGIATVIAKRLNCSKASLYNYQKRFPWILDLRQEAREGFVDFAESKLMKKVQEESDWAIKFTLTSIGRHRGYDNGPAVVVNNNTLNATVKLNDEQKKEFLDFIDNKE